MRRTPLHSNRAAPGTRVQRRREIASNGGGLGGDCCQPPAIDDRPAILHRVALYARLRRHQDRSETRAMTTRPPADIGMPLDEVDTPALIIDLDAFDRNLARLPDRIAGTGVRLRPHAKTHKCPVIALQQIARGAV